MGYVKAKVLLGPGVVLNFSRVVMVRSRGIPPVQPLGLDLLVSNSSSSKPGAFLGIGPSPGIALAWNAALVWKTCLTPDMYEASIHSWIRPDAVPGNQSATGRVAHPAPGPCVNSSAVPPMRRCWAGMGMNHDVVINGLDTDALSKSTPTGYLIWTVNMYYLCQSVMSNECVAAYGPGGCFRISIVPTFTDDEEDLNAGLTVPPASSPPPAPLPSPGALQLPDASAGSGGGGRGASLLGPLLGGLLGGAVAIAAAAAVAWALPRTRRRRAAAAAASMQAAANVKAQGGTNGGAGGQVTYGSSDDTAADSRTVGDALSEILAGGIGASDPGPRVGAPQAQLLEVVMLGPAAPPRPPPRERLGPLLALLKGRHAPGASAPPRLPVVYSEAELLPVTEQTPFAEGIDLNVRVLPNRTEQTRGSPAGYQRQRPGVDGVPEDGSSDANGGPDDDGDDDRDGVGVGAAGGGASGGDRHQAPHAQEAGAVELLPTLLGKGGCGRVVLGLYRGRRVAVKLLNLGLAEEGPLKGGGAKAAAPLPEEPREGAAPVAVENAGSAFHGLSDWGSALGGLMASATMSTVVAALEAGGAASQASAASHDASAAAPATAAAGKCAGEQEPNGGPSAPAPVAGPPRGQELGTAPAANGEAEAGPAAAAVALGLAEVAAAAGGVEAQQQPADGVAAGAGRPVVAAVARGPLATLAQEVEVLARCRHPNVVTLHAANLTPPRVCLVMELMDTSLARLVHGGPGEPPVEGQGQPRLMPLPKVLHIGLQVARALSYLHPTIMHRDLKPGNVLVSQPDSPTPVVKLADFGLSRLRSSVLVTSHPEVGTVPYMAPEVFDAFNIHITDRVDIWAFGVIMWEMLTGQRPWEGMDSVQIAYAIIVLRKRLPLDELDERRCPPKLAALMASCWELVPDRRPAAAELVKALAMMQATLA
ncbi:hypothetical protein GPECTOR_83g303 [Gonium pectorale]|uniref:Protein kinase domain-containing protein n=1 Tax=Gonium pectorale TaxID=33097 RepID=A0A150G1K7_GONPE|nr:hypothetical protein GPECTOR_83g303 [Gonium pectorale]|eukprot:KXZ43691.1 hypothetical protein GPECTOR_83g303 [Gonium pectorale]